VYYYYADGLGTVHTVTNATGTPCYDATFTPYGQEVDNPNISQTCAPNYRFTGYELDSETGLYYAIARYYSPRLSRFMSTDPLAGGVSNPQSLNRYAYVLNNPTSLIDPLGLDSAPLLPPGETSGLCFISGFPTPFGDIWQWTGDDLSPGCGDGGPQPLRGGGGGGGSQHSRGGSGASNQPKPQKQGCTVLDPIFSGLEHTGKLGPEVQVGPFKTGFSFYKNFTTGESGAEGE
jgi:RHS repeat-associated protein